MNLKKPEEAIAALFQAGFQVLLCVGRSVFDGLGLGGAAVIDGLGVGVDVVRAPSRMVVTVCMTQSFARRTAAVVWA